MLKGAFYFFDCGDQRPNVNIDDCYALAVVSSPKYDNYKDFGKHMRDKGQLCQMYMPVWSYSEVMALYELKVDKTVISLDYIEEVYKLWGGVPRHVFDCVKNPSIDIDKCKRDILQCIRENTEGLVAKVLDHFSDVGSGTGKAHSHIMYHLIPDESYSQITVVFASSYVSEQVFIRLKDRSKNFVIHLINRCAGQPTLAGIRGQNFEQYVHATFFGGGGKYSVRSLEEPRNRKFAVRPVSNIQFEKLSEVSSAVKKVYYLP